MSKEDNGTEIAGIRQDKSGVITHVAVLLPVKDIAEDIDAKTGEFFTNRGGSVTRVYAKKSTKGNEYLTTDPDDTRENNLDFLPNI